MRQTPAQAVRNRRGLACLLAAAIVWLAACTPDPTATAKAWKPKDGGPALGKAVAAYPYFKYAVWDYYPEKTGETTIEMSAEFDLSEVRLACPDKGIGGKKSTWRAFLVLRLAESAKNGGVTFLTAVVQTYDAKGYHNDVEIGRYGLDALYSQNPLLTCEDFYATPGPYQR